MYYQNDRAGGLGIKGGNMYIGLVNFWLADTYTGTAELFFLFSEMAQNDQEGHRSLLIN